MAGFHIDPTCDAALVRLNDAFCSFERSTGRNYSLILIPHNSGEEIHLSEGGKPLSSDAGISAQEFLDLAMVARTGNERT